jgi:multisubunit Na+/H+ antiporter MnhG subunit
MTKTLSQKVTYAIAILCYLTAVGCAIGAFYYTGSSEDASIAKASLGATAFFFFTTGVVLHVIGTAKLKGLLQLRD